MSPFSLPGMLCFLELRSWKLCRATVHVFRGGNNSVTQCHCLRASQSTFQYFHSFCLPLNFVILFYFICLIY